MNLAVVLSSFDLNLIGIKDDEHMLLAAELAQYFAVGIFVMSYRKLKVERSTPLDSPQHSVI